MDYDLNKNGREEPRDSEIDLNALLHPAQAFDRPMDVVRDPDLTLNEKRAILASWASDACAVEAAPALRAARGKLVRWDDIMDALRSLDDMAAKEKPVPRIRHWKHRRWQSGGASDVGSQLS